MALHAIQCLWHGTIRLLSVPKHETTHEKQYRTDDEVICSWGFFSRIRKRASIPQESKHCNTDGIASKWTAGETTCMLKNKPHHSQSTNFYFNLVGNVLEADKLKVLCKSIGLCKTYKEKGLSIVHQFSLFLYGESSVKISMPNGLILAEIWMKI